MRENTGATAPAKRPQPPRKAEERRKPRRSILILRAPFFLCERTFMTKRLLQVRTYAVKLPRAGIYLRARSSRSPEQTLQAPPRCRWCWGSKCIGIENDCKLQPTQRKTGSAGPERPCLCAPPTFRLL